LDVSSVEDYKKLREYEKETFEKMVSQVRYKFERVVLSVLRIRDVYPGSEFFPSRIQAQKDYRITDPQSASKN
jgi:hypothetical protein